jgi:hypothetical protein
LSIFCCERIPAFAASLAACTVACVPDGQSHLQKLQLKTAKVAKTASQPAKTTVVSLLNSAFCENEGLELHFLQVMRLKSRKSKK